MPKRSKFMAFFGGCFAALQLAALTAGAAPVRCYFPIPVESEVTAQTPDVLTKAYFAVTMELLPEPITPKNAADRADGNDGLAVCSRVLQAVCGRDWDTYRSMICPDLALVKGEGYLFDMYDVFMAKNSDYAIYGRTSVGQYTCYIVDMEMTDGVHPAA